MTFNDWILGGTTAAEVANYMYDLKHWLTLAILLVVTVAAVCVLSSRIQSKAMAWVMRGLVFGVLAFEVARRTIMIIGLTDYTWETVGRLLLPVELFSIAAILLVVAFFLRRKQLMNFTVIFGLAVTVLYFLYPASGTEKNFFNTEVFYFPQIYSLVVPVCIFIFSVLAIKSNKIQFEIKKIYWPLGYLALAIGYGVALNLAIFPAEGANYMYIMADQTGWFTEVWVYRTLIVVAMVLLIATVYTVPAIRWSYSRFKNRLMPVVYKDRAMKRTGMNNFTEKEATFKRSGGLPDYELTKEEVQFRKDRDKINNKKK